MLWPTNIFSEWLVVESDVRKDTSRKAGPQLTLGAVLFPQKKKTLFELRQYAIHIGVVSDIHISILYIYIIYW